MNCISIQPINNITLIHSKNNLGSWQRNEHQCSWINGLTVPDILPESISCASLTKVQGIFLVQRLIDLTQIRLPLMGRSLGLYMILQIQPCLPFPATFFVETFELLTHFILSAVLTLDFTHGVVTFDPLTLWSRPLALQEGPIPSACKSQAVDRQDWYICSISDLKVIC